MSRLRVVAVSRPKRRGSARSCALGGRLAGPGGAGTPVRFSARAGPRVPVLLPPAACENIVEGIHEPRGTRQATMLNNGLPENGLLDGKTALIYGGGGAVGGAVARAFAAEGATVHIAGRTESRLEKVANDIREAGGTAETAVVDALDEEQVDAFVSRVAKKSKRIDISFNVISFGDDQQPLMEIDVDDFTQPI